MRPRTSPSLIGAAVGAVLVVLAAACGDDGGDASAPAFPDNYADSYTEVRNCRPNGGSHDFNRIRVLADPAALAAYRDRMEPFPEGAVVLKEEYDPNDMDCTGDVTQWTVMERLPQGSDENLGWRWQQVDASGTVIAEDLPRCYGCHAACVPPDGYEGTCTVP